MDLPSNYMTLPHDLSGSRSKNRFRIELLWGISKMLDLMERPENFTMVFDYVCDIEVHKENGFDFFQIKTKGNDRTYTAKNLTKKASEGSILGKLYVLVANTPGKHSTVALVTNAAFHSFPSGTLTNCFSTLPQTDKDIITSALKEELKTDTINLDNVFYIQTPMDLEHPEDSVRGHLVLAFERIKKCEPTNPNALYRLIVDTVSERACYEYTAQDYSEILHLKGLSRKEFDDLLSQHAEDSVTGVQQAKEYISSLGSINERHKCNIALPKAVQLLSTSRIIKAIEHRIVEYLLANDAIDTEQALEALEIQFDSEFPIEISKTERFLVFLIVLKRFEGGAYENETSL